MAYPVKSQVASPYAQQLAKQIQADLGPGLADTDAETSYVKGAGLITDLIAAFYELDATNIMSDAALANIVTACTSA